MSYGICPSGLGKAHQSSIVRFLGRSDFLVADEDLGVFHYFSGIAAAKDVAHDVGAVLDVHQSPDGNGKSFGVNAFLHLTSAGAIDLTAILWHIAGDNTHRTQNVDGIERHLA